MWLWAHLVGRRELGPGFVGSAVVVVSVGGLDVLVEAQDFPGLKFSHSGPLGQLITQYQSQIQKAKAVESVIVLN